MLKSMTKGLIGLALGLGIACSAFALPNNDVVASAAQKTQKASYLFVLMAKKAIIKPSKDGNYVVVLRRVSPRVLMFSDRPDRKAGHIKSKKFLQKWPTMFAKDSPNVGFVHADLKVNKHGVSQALALELSNPVAKRNGRVWKFKAKVLNGDKIMPGTFRNVAFFIDNLYTTVSFDLSNVLVE